jgi:hypothetical protein
MLNLIMLSLVMLSVVTPLYDLPVVQGHRDHLKHFWNVQRNYIYVANAWSSYMGATTFSIMTFSIKGRQADGQAGRLAGRQTGRQADWQAGRRAGR